MPRINIATCAELPELDEDGPALLSALEALGIDARPLIWRRGIPPEQNPVLLRSVWDYHDHHAEFIAWCEGLETQNIPLWNSPDMVRWNSDKRYLAELNAAGIPTIPTTFLSRGEKFEHWENSEEWVVKPNISAGSKLTLRRPASKSAELQDLIKEIHALNKVAMVQPYIKSVDRRGETALIFFSGEYSHAIRKSAILQSGAPLVDDLYAAETIEAIDAKAQEMALAERCLNYLSNRFEMPLYLRVDVVENDGDAEIIEVEAIEPALFLSYSPKAAQNFAQAILKRWPKTT